jgi:hypothetical protein
MSDAVALTVVSGPGFTLRTLRRLDASDWIHDCPAGITPDPETQTIDLLTDQALRAVPGCWACITGEHEPDPDA